MTTSIRHALCILLLAPVSACNLPQRVDTRPDAPASTTMTILGAARPGDDPADHMADPIAHAEAARMQQQQALQQARNQARSRLDKLEQTTNLADRQLQHLRAAELALARGDAAAALERIEVLDASLQQAIRTHRVRPGESLWRIAARAEVYGNGLMWPLLWDANREQLPNPSLLRVGQLLNIQTNPSVADVVAAIATAKRQLRRSVEVGPIQVVD